jgi:FG-GAP repeat
MEAGRGRTVGGLAIALWCAGAALPCAAGAALPRTYAVQAVDRPAPLGGGGFGLGFVNAGDVDRDGRDDLLVGTNPREPVGGSVYVISGATGAALRAIPAPDADPRAGFGSHVGRIADLGSCPGGAPGATCPHASTGALDGIPDQLVSAPGVDVGGLVDAGRAYVLDGATGAVLKRLDLPPADLAAQAAAPGGPARPAFGRAILSPASPFGRTEANLSGPSAPAAAVRLGDLNGGGRPDIVVGASDYAETGVTAQPGSPCAAAAANVCLQAGRAYVFFGEAIAGSSPAVPDNSPDATLRNPAAEPDDPLSPVNAGRESFGLALQPVGDLGRCTAVPGASAACVATASSGDEDGRPEVLIGAHRSDDFGMADVGIAHLVDGATLSVLARYHHPEPQPAALFGFAAYAQPAVGDLGGTRTPDLYLAAMRQNSPYTASGKGYALNGAFRQASTPDAVGFATFIDPTPHPGENFGTSSAGLGNVVGAEAGLDGRTEVMIGANGPEGPAANAAVVNDVHIFSALAEQPLQTLRAPDPQPGAGFGTALAPLGDLNGDGLQDYAIGAGTYDAGASDDQGRIYLFRSDNSPVPPTAPRAPEAPAAPPAPPGPPGAAGPAGPPGPRAIAAAGRALTLVASRTRVRRRVRVRMRGLLEAFANPAGCRARQRVEIQRRPLGRLRYARVARVRTAANGSFALRVRPTATADYRARIGQTAACLGATSAAERVTVTRRGGR